MRGDRAKSIWYISKYFAHPTAESFGGRGYNLMRELSKLGYDVTVLASDANHLDHTPAVNRRYLLQRRDGMKLVWVRTLKFRSAKSVRRILSWLDFEFRILRMRTTRVSEPDVIVVSSLSLLSILSGIRLARRHTARLIFEVRDIWPLTLTEDGGFSPRNPLVRALAAVERLGYRRADAIVGTMPNLGEHVTEVLGEARPVACIPMGYDDSAVDPPLELPTQYLKANIPSGRFTVGYAGTIGLTNALDVLFQAAQLLSEDPNIVFVVVGEGGLRAFYEERFGSLPNVVFTGPVPRRSVQAVLAQFDALYFSARPSRVWHYGQSLNKLVDYMLSGRPIIASYTGFPSMINEAECGVFVPAGDAHAIADAVRRLASAGRLEREEMGRRGRRWILENRSYQRLAADYETILFPPGSSRTSREGST